VSRRWGRPFHLSADRGRLHNLNRGKHVLDYKTLALTVARQHAPDLAIPVRDALQGTATPAGTTNLSNLLVTCAQRAVEAWAEHPDLAYVVDRLYASIPSDPQIADETRREIIARVVDQVAMGFGKEQALPTKKQFIDQWLQSERDFFGVPLLQPFADMHYWILARTITWTPPVGTDPSTERVTVPRGFVTDLASVPRLFWALISSGGRHGHAAILHDWLYWKQTIPREMADHVLELAMKDVSVPAIARSVIFSSVRVFGETAWTTNERARLAGERRVLQNFPTEVTTTWEEWRRRPEVFCHPE
jgi:Protein of unknown function (DUF1353)